MPFKMIALAVAAYLLFSASAQAEPAAKDDYGAFLAAMQGKTAMFQNGPAFVRPGMAVYGLDGTPEEPAEFRKLRALYDLKAGKLADARLDGWHEGTAFYMGDDGMQRRAAALLVLTQIGEYWSAYFVAAEPSDVFKKMDAAKKAAVQDYMKKNMSSFVAAPTKDGYFKANGKFGKLERFITLKRLDNAILAKIEDIGEKGREYYATFPIQK